MTKQKDITMASQVTITLNQLGVNNPWQGGWDKILEAQGGENANYDKPFPLSTVLDSNNLDDTLGCLKRLPEQKGLLAEFTLFCVKEAALYTDDYRVHDCIGIIEDYLEGNATSDEVLAMYRVLHAIYSHGAVEVHSGVIAARAVMYAAQSIVKNTEVAETAEVVANFVAVAETAEVVANFVTEAAEFNNATTYLTENQKQNQKQADYLRRLLDGVL